MAKKKAPTRKKKKPGRPASSGKAAAERAKAPTITTLRRKLDEIDRQVLAAVNERAELARQIGEAKKAAAAGVYDAKREKEVIDRAVSENTGPLGDNAVRAIFREIVSGSRSVQAPTRVAYLGPQFTFSHLAALERFGHSAELVPVGTIGSVFEEVERGHAEHGVVPMENSTDGRVADTLERFSRSTVRICGELPLRIHHCLLGVGRQDQIEVVYSKPQALSQCRNWIAKHLPSASTRPVGSTAEAAEFASSDPSMAAVASQQAAANYELKVLVRNIEDNSDNITRFAVIGSTPAKRTGSDKTALMLEIAHQPGALADAMAIFKRNRLNMTWIESFPIPGSRGRYLFFVEFVGHQQELRSRRAIAALEKKAVRLEVLGSYAQVEPIG